MLEALRTLRPSDRPLAALGVLLRRAVQGPLGDHDRVTWAIEAGAKVRRASGRYYAEHEGLSVACRPNSSDFDVFLSCVTGQQYSPSVHGMEPPEVVLDLGANIGCSALYLARLWPHARIVAVEPDPENFEILKENVKRNNARVECVHAAVWDADEGVRIGRGRGRRPQWARFVERGGEVPGMTVPTLLGHHEVDRVGFLKVDVEGAETRVFRDAPWLAFVDRLAIETHGPEAAEVVERACGTQHLKLLHHHGEVSTYAREGQPG